MWCYLIDGQGSQGGMVWCYLLDGQGGQGVVEVVG